MVLAVEMAAASTKIVLLLTAETSAAATILIQVAQKVKAAPMVMVRTAVSTILTVEVIYVLEMKNSLSLMMISICTRVLVIPSVVMAAGTGGGRWSRRWI